MDRSKTAITAFLVLLTLAFMGSTAYYLAKADRYAQYIEYSNERAFSDLVTQLSQMDSALSKLRYASSRHGVQTIAAKLWQSSESAKASLSSLSASPGAGLDKTQKFVAQSGDFAFYLLSSSSGGSDITDDERSSIDSLYSASELVTREIGAVKNQLDIGQISFDSIGSDLPYTDAIPLSGSMSGVEQEFPEYATLIYDGPFSEHLSYSRPRLLEGLEEVSTEQAMKYAASFAGIPVTKLSLLYEGGDKIKTFCFTTDDGTTIEIAKNGGIVFGFRKIRDVASSLISPEEAVGLGKAFLEEHGFKNMRESYYSIYDGIVTVNYAFEQNGITVYGDLIKVSVALDDGEILGMEARGYLMSHTSRTLSAPAVSQAEGRQKLDPRLSVVSSRLALIPTSGEHEILCHEYVCKDENGANVIVYINAATGQEENMYILLEDENGMLVV